MMKNCPRCKTVKPESAFWKNSQTKSGLSSKCKPCSKEYSSALAVSYRGRQSEVASKDCVKCKKNKPASEFSVAASRKDGRSGYCKPCFKAMKRTKYTTPSSKYSDYRGHAAYRGIEFTLTRAEFEMFWQKPCFYCDGAISSVGLDRMDNSRGYFLGNIASCCATCNRAKLTLGKDEFIAHCRKVAVKSDLSRISPKATDELIGV